MENSVPEKLEWSEEFGEYDWADAIRIVCKLNGKEASDEVIGYYPILSCSEGTPDKDGRMTWRLPTSVELGQAFKDRVVNFEVGRPYWSKSTPWPFPGVIAVKMYSDVGRQKVWGGEDVFSAHYRNPKYRVRAVRRAI